VESPTTKEFDILQTKLLFTLGTAAWLIAAHSTFAEEVNITSGNNAGASQTATTDGTVEGTGDSVADEAVPMRRTTPLGSNEWRRNDSAGRQGKPSDGRPGGSKSGSSRGESGESGGGGGDVD
jgi:hypothetical protein